MACMMYACIHACMHVCMYLTIKKPKPCKTRWPFENTKEMMKTRGFILNSRDSTILIQTLHHTLWRYTFRVTLLSAAFLSMPFSKPANYPIESAVNNSIHARESTNGLNLTILLISDTVVDYWIHTALLDMIGRISKMSHTEFCHLIGWLTSSGWLGFTKSAHGKRRSHQ